MSLSTFFKVATGQYSDDQIRAAAAAYYGRTSAAAVAAVNNDITVNVNIDGETVKQFKPEQPVKQEKKPEPPKQPEKQPEPPKQPEKKSEPPKQSEKKPEPPKQSEKPEPKQPEQPAKKPEQQEKPKQPKTEQQDVAAQQAAHPVNGFNIAAFTTPQQMAAVAAPVSTPMQPAPIPTTQPTAVATMPLLPAEYNSMPPSEKCDVLFDLAVRGVLPPFANPRAGFTNQQKLNELKKNFTFLHIEGRSISTLQLDMLYGLLESPRLKSAMNRHDAIDRANNPKLTEVPVTTHATGEQTKKYDMCFEVKLKDPAKKLVVLYSTVPAFSMATGTWGQELELFVK